MVICQIFYPHEWILLLPGEHLKNPMKSGSLVAESDCGKLDRKLYCHFLSGEHANENLEINQPVSKCHQVTSSDIKWHQVTSSDIKWHQVTLPENHLGHADAVRRWPRWPSTSPQSTSAAGSAPPPPPPPTSRDPMWRTTPTTPCPTRPQSGGMGAEVFFLGWWCLVGYLMGINGSSSPYFPFFVGYHSGSFSPFFSGHLLGQKRKWSYAAPECCTTSWKQ